MKNTSTKQLIKNIVFCLMAVLVFAVFSGCPGAADTAFEQSNVPTATTASVAKTAAVQKSVTFALSSIHHSNSIWKVYDAPDSGIVIPGLAVTYRKSVNANTGEFVSTLVLTSFLNDIAAGTYYISVTERDRAESERFVLAVTQP